MELQAGHVLNEDEAEYVAELETTHDLVSEILQGVPLSFTLPIRDVMRLVDQLNRNKAAYLKCRPED